MIADNSEVFRTGLKLIINNTPYWADVKDTDSNGGFIDLIELFRPAVLFLNIERNEASSFIFLSTITNRFAGIKIIAIYEKNEQAFVQQLFEQNTHGVIYRDSPASEFLQALDQVLRDHVFYCQHTLTLLSAQAVYARRNAAKHPGEVAFTRREKQIIALLCEECTAKEIADKLILSKRTVENVKMKIQEKMHAKNTAGIVRYACQFNLLENRF